MTPSYVCMECFEDQGIRSFIEARMLNENCSFCREIPQSTVVAKLQHVIEHMHECLLYEYDNADNWLVYESREGGYQGHWMNTAELLFEIGFELPRDDEGRLLDEIVSALPDYAWCEQEPYTVNDQNRARFSWEHFSDVVMHRRRFFFESYQSDEYGIDSPGEILRRIFEYAKHYDLFKLVPAGRSLFRARYQKPACCLTTARDLGPPPAESATQSNRMSPPGIPMFYAGQDIGTALRETAEKSGTYAVGLFKTTRDITILDLSKIPPTPSLFQSFPESLEFRPREILRFLNHIATEISKPIKRDDKIHINYVPTQVVTEFVRGQVTTGNHRIDGIKFESSVHPQHASYVLFATQENLVLDEENQWRSQSNQWLRLAEVDYECVSSEQILKWKEEFGRPTLHELPLFDSANVV